MDKFLITPVSWLKDSELLLFEADQNTIQVDQIIEKSKNFPIKFPIHSIPCQTLLDKVSKEQLEKNINSVYPVIHEFGLHLCARFIWYQRQHGTNPGFYKNMTLLQLIDRLLKKRAVMFLTASDEYLLMDGTAGAGNWESIGTLNEKAPLLLENCLSYDEIRLSALLSVSSNSYFINDGNRFNSGQYENDRNKIEENGVIIGLIGTRLEKPNVMEYRDIIKSREQSVGDEEAIDKEFFLLYGEPFKRYDELKQEMDRNTKRYLKLGNERYFDKVMYEKRIAISIDTLLIEANDRAKQQSKKAYVHVVGLGLGVWKIHPLQNSIFMDTCAQRLEALSSLVQHVSDVRFAYMHETSAGKYKHGDSIAHIKIHIENTNPQQKLTGDDEGKLLVVSYAWDGNALPGNEFWGGSLSGSGDPAAACSSQIAEIHNPHINDCLCARNLRIATSRGLFKFNEYQDLFRNVQKGML